LRRAQAKKLKPQPLETLQQELGLEPKE
jgi:hypothetical protein